MLEYRLIQAQHLIRRLGLVQMLGQGPYRLTQLRMLSEVLLTLRPHKDQHRRLIR